MNIQLGKTQCNMMNPPNEGTVTDSLGQWKIARNYMGLIYLKRADKPDCHPEFVAGKNEPMAMHEFVCWINSKLQ